MDQLKHYEKKWITRFKELETFLEENGGQLPTQKGHPELYAWYNWQRQALKRHPESPHWTWKLEMLSGIGIYLDPPLHRERSEVEAETTTSTRSPKKDKRWQENFDALKAFMEEHSGELPCKETHSQLYYWLRNQRESQKKNPDAPDVARKNELFASIGVDVHTLFSDKAWTKKWEMLKEYMASNEGKRPTEKDNPQLYLWLLSQRQVYKKNPDRMNMKRRTAMLAELGINITLTAKLEKELENTSAVQDLLASQQWHDQDDECKIDPETLEFQSAKPIPGEVAAANRYAASETASDLLPSASEFDPDYDTKETVDNSAAHILDRFNFARRCCGQSCCAFRNIKHERLPAEIEMPLVDTILAYHAGTSRQKWDCLEKWIVDRTNFRIILPGGQSVGVCTTALRRILELNQHSRLFLHVLKASFPEESDDDPVEVEKDRLVKTYFSELETKLKLQHEQEGAKFTGPTTAAGYEAYCSYVASKGGQKAGINLFGVYWSYHYPKLLAKLGIKSPAAPSTPTKSQHTKRSSSLDNNSNASLFGGGSRNTRWVTPAKRSRPNETTTSSRGSNATTPYERLYLSPGATQEYVRHWKPAVIVTRTPSTAVRAKRRKLGVLRRRPVFAVR